MAYVGRFAPSPSGPLHAGSLLTALASYLDARAQGGHWLLRIEDIDQPRCDAAYADRIMQALRALGLQWDGPVLWQSRRLQRYQAVFETLSADGRCYPCACTRKQLRAELAAGEEAPYPGTCRNGLPNDQPARAWRLRLNDTRTIRFEDRLLGSQAQCPAQQCGDFVIRRADGLFAYQWVVVIDDWDQHISHIVRGQDLLSSSGRQIQLQQMLGAPQPEYLHLPLIIGRDGRKLSKQNGAAEVDWLRQPQRCLNQALEQLGQPTQQGSISRMLQRACSAWDPARIPRLQEKPTTGL